MTTPLTKEQREKVFEIIAQHTGQCTSDPVKELEKLGLNNNDEALGMLDDNVFYCESCGWWCDADERYDGDICTDCHDEGNE